MNCFMDFEALGKDSVSSVGGKNASLGEMIRAGILVPPGFAVTTDGFLGFITDTGVKDRIYGLLSFLRMSKGMPLP